MPKGENFMNTKAGLLFATFLVASDASELSAQGYIRFDNISTSNGLVYLASNVPGGLLLNQDVNFEMYAGATPFSYQPVHKWLVSDGSAVGINVAPGQFEDPSHSVFQIPGVQPGGIAYIAIGAWTGN